MSTDEFQKPAPEAIASDADRQRAEAERLALLPAAVWRLALTESASMLGIAKADLRSAVLAIIREREQAQRRAERTAREKSKALAGIMQMPTERRGAALTDLAKRLDLDLDTLLVEFKATEGEAGATPSCWHVDPWHKPVPTGTLINELSAKLATHVVMKPHEVLAVALWTAMAWVHDRAAYHSPFLVATSPEPNSGKTTLLGVLQWLTPRPYASAEPSGPAIFRLIDADKPTLYVDECDDLFARKSDLRHIVNHSWTRGGKVPRIIGGVSYSFDVFCPKVFGLLGFNMPRALASRAIVIKMLPKRADEKVVDFNYGDDPEFETLRRKLARWSDDHAEALKDATPALPPNFNNRTAANWRLLLAIAELGGAKMSEQARKAAERLSSKISKPSWGVRLLEAMRPMLAGREVIASAEVLSALLADPDGAWVEYKSGAAITQRQVADLLEQYDIHPVVIHPTKRKDSSARGYKVEQFEDAFARYLPADPYIRTSRKQ